MTEPAAEFLDGPNGRIAYLRRAGDGPTVVWFGGFRSDMRGTKATFIDEWCKHHGRAFLRFDYSGHGESDGEFADGAISDWAADAAAAVAALTAGPLLIVGSSMGAWIATLFARNNRDRIAGAVFIAPAPDFTERLMAPSFTDAERAALQSAGRIERPSDHDEPEIITRRLIEDGRANLVLDGEIPITAPVRILQGMADDAVPWRHATEFAGRLASDDVEINMTKSGDHRLSTDEDLVRLAAVLESFR